MISMLIYIYFFNSVFFSISESYKIFIGGFGITILGLFDDIFYFSARIKLFFQVLIILFMYYLGFQINVLTNPFGVDLILGYLSLPITIFWFLLVINAINLIDGMDGLAAGISMITFLVLMFVGIKFKSYETSIISAILLGSTVGFLKYNFFSSKNISW